MLTRAKFPRSKNVMIVNDVPVKSEIELEEKFSASSNLNILTALRTGRVNVYNGKPVENFQGILSTDIYTTYLDYTYYGEETGLEKNYDFNKELRKAKDLEQHPDGFLYDKKLPELGIFQKLENHKDVYISKRLLKQFEALVDEINKVEPKLIIVTGKWSLFFLTGCVTLAQTMGTPQDRKPLGGLVKYRASILRVLPELVQHECILVPMYPPVSATTMPDKVPIMELDVQKLGWMYQNIMACGIKFYTEPKKEYIIGTDKATVMGYLNQLKLRVELRPTLVSCDIETMFKKIIDCIGITDSPDRGLCIPFATVDNPNYWSLEDETDIMVELRYIMEHPNCLHVGQNYSYEHQCYFGLWLMQIEATYDTMCMHHILYNYLPKDLAFLASLYCEFYTYWKDDQDHKDVKGDMTVRWAYNIKDICYTLEIAEVLISLLEDIGGKLYKLYQFQQDFVCPMYNRVMDRGIRVDARRKEKLLIFFTKVMEDITKNINASIGLEFNQNSTPQKKKLFSDFFGMTLKTKKGGKETCDSAAMLAYIEEYPLLRPFLSLLLEYASLKVFVNNFLAMQLDDDGRARTSYNVSGTKTGRLSSRKNIRGKGGNFANIPEKGKIPLTYALEVIEDADTEVINDDLDLQKEVLLEGSIILPNIKKIFLPDEGMGVADGDYSGADAMVVAADSECVWLLDFFRNNTEKLYIYVVSEYLQKQITKDDPFYKKAKQFIHLCLTGEHEVLTREGWIRLDEYDRELEIAVFDKDSWNIHFETPSKFTESFVESEEDLHLIEGDSFYQLTTLDHKFCYKIDSNEVLKVTTAEKLPASSRLPYVGNYIGGARHFDEAYLRLIVALQADGHISYTAVDGTVTVIWRLKRQRKIDRLKDLLEEAGINYKFDVFSDGVTGISTKGSFETYMKTPDNWLLTLSKANLHWFVDELRYWDDSVRTSNGVRTSITNTNKSWAEWYQTIIQLTGKGSKILAKVVDGKPYYEVSINARKFYRLANGKRKLIKHKGTKVYCPTTTTGFFMVRCRGNIMVTGNTNYGGMEEKAAASSGLDVATAKGLKGWYFHKCPEIPKWHIRIREQIYKTGFIENIFGRRGWFLDRTDPTLLNKAYAFIPQSTIADLVNRAAVQITRTYPEMELLLQVHDSLVMQYPLEKEEFYVREMKRLMEIELPYPTPLIIPSDVKISSVSYGDTSKPKFSLV